MRFSVIIFVLTRCRTLFGDVVTTAPNSTDFVDILKRDLRRNNDDYLEATTISVIVPNPYLLETSKRLQINNTDENQTIIKDGIFSYRRVPPSNKLFVDTKNDSVVQRRVFNPLEEKSAERKSPATNKTILLFYHPTPSPKTSIYFVNTTKKWTTKMPQLNKTTFTIPIPGYTEFEKYLHRSRAKKKPVPRVTRTPGAMTKDLKTDDPVKQPTFRSSDSKPGDKRTNNVKNFVQRNKKLFDEFAQMKRKEFKKIKMPMYVKLRGGSSEDERSDAGAGGGSGQPRQRALSVEVTSLSPDQLDMAPGRGGKLHGMRVKGRLCHRNILVPEGPKYDSRGRVYVAAYGHAAGRDFSRTGRPKFLLPRCCNCCRKSLLGCE